MNIFDKNHNYLIRQAISFKLNEVSKDEETSLFYKNIINKIDSEQPLSIEELSKVNESLRHYQRDLKDANLINEVKVLDDKLSDHIIDYFKNEEIRTR